MIWQSRDKDWLVSFDDNYAVYDENKRLKTNKTVLPNRLLMDADLNDLEFALKAFHNSSLKNLGWSYAKDYITYAGLLSLTEFVDWIEELAVYDSDSQFEFNNRKWLELDENNTLDEYIEDAIEDGLMTRLNGKIIMDTYAYEHGWV